MKWPQTLLAGALLLTGRALADDAVGVEFFEKRIRPVLAEHCFECHSSEAKKVKGNLRLDTKADLLKGGEAGLAIIPGKPESSLLIKAVQYTDPDMQMPPPKNGSRKLPDHVIADLVEWVRMGAPIPEARVAKTVSQEHWAFVPPSRPQLPNVKDESWVKTGVDAFILAKLETNKLRPASPADKRTLIRRASFDLTGLPPKISDVESFLADNSPDSFKKVVDRLLSSPEYGERWSRHWLDVARYADTKGYVYDREERFFVHSWAYRDWVVRAFNDDMPYDRFLKLQIAADQLVEPRSPDLAAMGFITGGRRFIGITREIIDDRIDVVTRGAMGLTVACARCHDHKYDPISTRDYYSLYGVFEPGLDQLVNLGADPSDEEFQKRKKKYTETMAKRREEAAARLRARVGDYLTAQLELHKYPDEGFDQIFSDTDILPASVRRWRDYLHRTKDTFHPILAPWHALAKDEPLTNALTNPKLNPLIARHVVPPLGGSREESLRTLADAYGKLFKSIDKNEIKDPGDEELKAFLHDPTSPTTVPDTGIIANDQFFPTSVCEEIWKLQGEVERWLIRNQSSPPHALVVKDREPERNPRVFIRGNPARLGDEVPRQFLEVIAGPARKPFTQGSGRLELAHAVTSPENPLTARVMANRIWLGHFGSGLVRTPSDFGLRAEPPSHPELLDWLAHQFVDSGWSVKTVHRLIMLSSTYQQSSLAEPLVTDPDNRLLSHFSRNRLDLESSRDAMLASTGELKPVIGGKPTDLLAAANTRRTLYSLVDRQYLNATYRMFDFANPDIHVGQRHNTTVPQQALFFLNNPFVAERARALAHFDEKTPAETRVRDLYQKLYQREPTKTETKEALAFITAAEKDTPPPAPKLIETHWQYGWGEFDDKEKKIKSFNKLPHFTGTAWQGSTKFPDDKLGWVQLTATGGHPGNDLKHAAIRRWVAPSDGAISISSELIHEPEAGDGIRARIISSSKGELLTTTAHHNKVGMTVSGVEVKKGDTVDFVVDIRDNLNSDQFLWSPTIAFKSADALTLAEAARDFTGPRPKQLDPLQPWAQYAQALLLANEFSFVD